jgi:predicted ferric reductase
MGKGLAPATTGIHLAFAAGTGNLCFVDMLAHISLSVLGLLTKEDNIAGSIDPANFQMHLYASFPSKAEAVAYELCESLHNYCSRNNMKTFTLHPRLSKERVNPARWDEKWIEKTLRSYKASDVERMWVCGPPVMNETFDRTLMDMKLRYSGHEMIN